MKPQRHHFKVGVVNVSLRSACRSFMNEYLSLYQPYQQSVPQADSIDVEIKAAHRFPWRRGPFTIESDGIKSFKVQRRYEVLPHLEWIINWQIIKRRKDFMQLHAGALEKNEQALILPGDPGSGKSTLTTALLTRGWSYLCDEFALIEPATRKVHPYPRALCMKEASFPVVDRLGLPLYRTTPYQKPLKGRVAFLNPLDVRSDIQGKPSLVRWVIFPKYIAGSIPALEPITRSQAAYDLSKQCFNFQAYKSEAIRHVADVVRGADCYRLTSGDIHDTCDLVESQLLGDARDVVDHGAIPMRKAV
jgi:HprK-related kinase A